jgi:hypothetical protein
MKMSYFCQNENVIPHLPALEIFNRGMRNPWFDRLTMTIVTLSVSKGGFRLSPE